MDNQKYFKKQSHPRKTASVLSVLTYCWTLPVFLKGFRKDLEEEDLYEPLDEHASSILGDKLEESWRKEIQLHQNPSLLRALVRVFSLELVTFGFVLIFIELVLKMSQPLALSQLLLYYTNKENKIEKKEAFMYASIIVGACFGYTLVVHWYSLNLQHLGMKVRVACCSLIYRKSLRLSKTATGATTVGQMVNLLSNDVNRFDQAAVNLHSLWFVPIETVIIVYILYSILGLTSAIGVLIMTLFVPLQVYLGRTIANLRLKTALKTDCRIQLMNEIISGIQVIKMYTWEKPFINLVAIARKLEIDKIRATSYVRGVMLSFSIFTTRFAVFSSIVVYVVLGHDLKAEYVFVLISFYNILRQAVTRYYPQGIAQIGEAYVSISRIQKFLLSVEIDSNTLNTYIHRSLSTELYFEKQKFDQNENIGITIDNVSANWSLNSSHRTLSNINLTLYRDQLIAVTGPVGSGKTSLLQSILKELPLETGTITVKGRISYASQEPWLFSGTIRQNILFGQRINQERYNKVISACDLDEDFSTFPHGDGTIVGERGVTLSGGQKARVSLARAIYKEADIYLLDDPLSAVDAHVGRKLFKDCISNFLRNKCTILVTHQLQHLSNVQHIYSMENGHIIKDLPSNELQKLEAVPRNCYKTKELPHGNKNKNSQRHPLAGTQTSREPKEQRSFGKVAGDVYISYFRAEGSIVAGIFVFIMFLFTQLFASAGDYFIAYWVNLEKTQFIVNGTNIYENFPYLPREACIYIYSAIILSTVLVTLIRSFSFFKYCMEASKRLHNDMFSNIIHATMNFFNTNSSGRIHNRFSKDMGSIDETLPAVIMDCIQIGLTVIGVTVVVSLVNPWLLGVTGTILTIFYGLRIIYVITSRSIKRLEGTTRSPVFAHMNASLQGLTTIRAFGAQQILQMEFDNHQDLHSSAWYLFLCCTRAFGFWLDMICVAYIGIVTFSFLFMQKEEGGNVGLAITQAISLTGLFQWGMRQWGELENQMTSVERVAEYTKIERESDRTDIIPQPTWPQKGNIDFLAVSMRYSSVEHYVLKQLHISIKSNEKIGIVGRTGAGKTSLIYALFQLTEIEGTILIDDIDITKVPLQTLRSKISIIPQEPFLFSGTLRKNLDPFNEFTDAKLWNALAEVELKELIASLPAGVDEIISEGGSNFSVGQRQLICLARAIIRSNKILIMDEATANLDSKTDALIQATIRKKFPDCTVLTIAHRLYTIMDSDKVLVMDNGSVVEFDHPSALLSDVNSLFYAMVHQNGNLLMENFIKVVENGHKANSIKK